MTDLPDGIESLKALVQRLLEKIAQPEAENAGLRRRSGMDSNNSHKPPSSDGYGKKTVAPGLPEEKKSVSGGQPGHRGKTLKRVANPDRIQVHLPQQCECCGRQSGAGEAHGVMQSRQVSGLPEPELEVTEHRLAQIGCCGHVQSGAYPPEVTASVQYGTGVRALVTKLPADHKMPLEQISLLFEDMYGYDPNSATVGDALERAYALAEPVGEQIAARLSEAGLAHSDETGMRVAGKLHWLHTASTETLTHLSVHEKRGAAALNAGAPVLKDSGGTAVHDCRQPYFNFTGARHVLCGAHLLRGLRGLWKNGSLRAEDMHGFLLALYKMPRPLADAGQAHPHYRLILQQADEEEPPPQRSKRGKPEQPPGRCLPNRLREHEAGVPAFA